MDNKLLADVAAVQQIAAVSTILEVIAETTGMGFAAVARVTGENWVACEVVDRVHFGLKSGEELPLETTICKDVRALRTEVVIDNVAEDPFYAHHHTPATYGFQSYVSVPIIHADGDLFGTLCAIDAKPRALKGTAAVRMFRLFAELIAFHIDAQKDLDTSRSNFARSQTDLATSEGHLQASRSSLADSEARLATSRSDLADSEARLATSEADLAERKAEVADMLNTAELREQFIAVLGHDLRNPLASMNSGVALLSRGETDPKRVRTLRLMKESVLRMGGLVENVLDFARGRLGGGIGLDRTRDARIEPLLSRVVNEIRSVHPDRNIEVHFDLDRPVDVDASRFSQLLSNLLGNAVSHGSPHAPIIITASMVEDHFELSVANGGDAIPAEAMALLFKPFQRGKLRPNQEGLGLGLYIASEIAKAHGGGLDVTSDHEQTRFVFRMPVLHS